MFNACVCTLSCSMFNVQRAPMDVLGWFMLTFLKVIISGMPNFGPQASRSGLSIFYFR